jgi:chitinase
MKIIILAVLLVLSTATIHSPSGFLKTKTVKTTNDDKLFVAYFQSWSEKWSSTGLDTGLANLPSYINAVLISFMRPDCTYQGKLSLGGTGLDFSSDGSVVKASITALKAKNPNTKVLVAVGGATYTNFGSTNVQAIARFVQDFGLDGVDIDFEPSNPGCTASGGQVSCQSDQQYINVVNSLRNALPRPYILTTAGWSIGAYGQGSFANSQPQGAYTGVAVNMLKTVGSQLDWVNIMSYDASDALDPKEAFNAYRSLYSGRLAAGVEVPPEAWGGHVYTVGKVQDLANYVNSKGNGGMMLWSLHKVPNGSVSDDNPDALRLAQTVCNSLGLGNCSQKLFPWQ